MIKDYYLLTKPGIIKGNAFTAAAGFALASSSFDLWLFVATLVGLSLIIASGCVFNNYIDRGIDKKMKRTKNRALAANRIPGGHALVYGTLLGVGGSYLLGAYTNVLALYIALFGLVMYVLVYGYWKRHSVYGTLVGSVSGAVPPVVGYVVVSGMIDVAAMILFMILVFWQMPHFYAIALFRMKDYKAASIPVLPLAVGVRAMKRQTILYIAAFTFTASLLTFYGYTGYVYVVVVALLGLWWLRVSWEGFATNDDIAWSKRVFKVSLIVLFAVSVLIMIDKLLP